MSKLLDEIEKLEDYSHILRLNADAIAKNIRCSGSKEMIDSCQKLLAHADYLLIKAEGIDYATKQIRSMLFCELSKKEFK